jgi:predicted DNA-binding transcriptional regulator YafY
MAITFQIISEFSKNLLPMETVEFLKPYFSLSEKMLNSVTDNTLTKWPEKIRIINNWFPTMPPKQSEGILREIYTALLEERKVAVIYRKRGAETGTHYEVNPLGLVMKGSIFYLICTHAINPTLDDLRTFSLHRFESATVLDEHWTIPDGFDLDEQIKRGKFNYSDGSQIKVQFLFDKESAIHLRETPVSLDQRLTERQDGRILLEATILDSEPMRWWLLGFGNSVEVLAPETLRNEIISSIDGMLDRYR